MKTVKPSYMVGMCFALLFCPVIALLGAATGLFTWPYKWLCHVHEELTDD